MNKDRPLGLFDDWVAMTRLIRSRWRNDSRRTRCYRGLAILTICIILISLSLPGQWVSTVQVFAFKWWPWPSSGIASSSFPIDKIVHFFLFSVCGALFVRGWSSLRKRWWVVCASLFAYGVFTEFLQKYIPGRSPSIDDLGADFIGVLFGIVVTLSYFYTRFNSTEEIE